MKTKTTTLLTLACWIGLSVPESATAVDEPGVESIAARLAADLPVEERQAAVGELYLLAMSMNAAGDVETLAQLRHLLELHPEAPSGPEIEAVLDLVAEGSPAGPAEETTWLQVHLDAAKSFAWMGQYRFADALLERVEPCAESTEGLQRVDFHIVRGDVHMNLGRPSRAATDADVVADALERWDLGENHAYAMGFLATLRHGLGQYPATRALLRSAIARATKDEEPDALPHCWMELGLLSEHEGDQAGAIEYYDRILAAECCDPELAARTRVNRGRALRESGDLARARSDFEAALALSQGVIVHVEAGAHDGLARVALATGDYETAEAAIEVALAIERAQDLEDFLGYSLQTQALLALAREDLARARAAMSEADEIFERGDVENLSPRGLAELRSRYSKWSEIAQEIAALDIAQAETDEEYTRSTTHGLWQAGRWSARALLAGMRESSGLGLELGPEELLEAVSPSLGKRRALVRFVETTEALHVYVVHDGRVRWADLGPKAAAHDAARRFVLEVCETAAIRSPAGVARMGYEVYRRTLAEVLEPLPPAVDELVLIPTERLAAVPFEATVREASAQTFADMAYLAKDYDVLYVPSVACLAHLSRCADLAGEGRGLFLGDTLVPMEYGGLPLEHRLSEEQYMYEPLPASRTEAIAMALKSVSAGARDELYADYGRLLDSKERDESWSTVHFDVLLGGLANPSALSKARSYDRIHVAAHSFVDLEEPSFRGMVLSPDPDDDGLLDLAEIRDLELDAELVVLSGCGTARGRALGGEGIQSIAAAFLEAGGRSVVASLWRVDDLLTSELMAEFYDGLDRQQSVQGALEAAKRSLWARGTRGLHDSRSDEVFELSSYHPRVWAAFIYVGPPR